MTTAPTLAPDVPEDPDPSGASGASGVAGRPVWALTGEQMLTELDALHVGISRAETRRLALLAGLDQIGYAKEIGARGTADLIARRHRLDPPQVYRDLRLAKTLPKYPVVQQGLDNGPHTGPHHPDTGTGTGTGSDGPEPTGEPAGEPTGDAGGAGDGGGRVGGVLGLYPRQAEAIVTALERVPSTVPVENVQVAETEMVIAARTATPADLRRLGRWALDRLDPDGRDRDEDAARAKERLTLSRDYTGHGLRFRGFLSNENAELFQALIDRCSKPRKITTTDGKSHLDPRTKTQRQADALVQILHTAAAASNPSTPSSPTPGTPSSSGAGSTGGTAGTGGTGGSGGSPAPAGSAGSAGSAGAGQSAGSGESGEIGIPAHGGIRPHIMVTIELAQLLAAGRQHTGDLLFGDRLSAAAVRRLACDASIIPIVLGTHSEPLDVGREFRSVTPAIRKALIARDQGCVVCAAPPGWCDAHHLDHWADGGLTSLDNTVLGCKPCHREIHKGIWQITITNGTVHITGPHYKPHKRDRTPPRPASHSERSPTERPPPTTT